MTTSPTPDEIVFLGVVSSSVEEHPPKEGYPLAFGVSYPDPNTSRNILICPPEEWNVFDLKQHGKIETVSGLRRDNLLKKGITPEEAAGFLLDAVKARAIYCMDVNQVAQLLTPLRDFMTARILLNSALRLFNELTGDYKRAMAVQVHSKLVMQNYPRNSSDVRWMSSCFHGCRHG